MAVVLYSQIAYNRNYWYDFLTTINHENLFIGILDKFPMLLFILACLVIVWFSFTRKLSLIPVLGLLSCLFLMTKLGYTNWLRFLIWLGIRLILYFSYSRKHSKLGRKEQKNPVKDGVML